MTRMQGVFFRSEASRDSNLLQIGCQDKAAFITGSTFLMDGGATASYYYGPLKPEN